MRKIYCFGTSGGCLDAFYLHNEVAHTREKTYFLSDNHAIGDILYGCEVAGSFQSISTLDTSDCEFIYQCGSSENHVHRHIWYKRAKDVGLSPRTLISKDAYIHDTVSIGQGSIIYPGVKIMTNVVIGENCVVLPNTVINHDTQVGDFSIINSSCVLNGGIQLGNNCYLGSSSSIKENCIISHDTTIGMASCVLNSVNKPGIYFGSPAKFIR